MNLNDLANLAAVRNLLVMLSNDMSVVKKDQKTNVNAKIVELNKMFLEGALSLNLTNLNQNNLKLIESIKSESKKKASKKAGSKKSSQKIAKETAKSKSPDLDAALQAVVDKQKQTSEKIQESEKPAKNSFKRVSE